MTEGASDAVLSIDDACPAKEVRWVLYVPRGAGAAVL